MTTTINILNMKFDPDFATPRVGDTVTWINKDPFNHELLAETTNVDGNVEELFLSPIIKPNGVYNFIFDFPMNVNISCTIHLEMKSQLQVVDRLP